MGFAACTNEVEEFSTQQNPTEAAKGIELGEGFKINVAYGGAEVDADTRAALERNETNTGWKASWQTGDKIGAAMYSMVTGKVTTGEHAGDVNSKINFLAENNIYASNNEFAYIENQDGITFESLSNSMVGAYLLYYPYNPALNNSAAFGEIPVYDKEKAVDKLKFNVSNIGEEVSSRIFAATVSYFKGGGTQASKFTVKQVPNLYMVKFSIAEKLQMAFTDEMQINQIIVEAHNAGTKVFNTNGIVKPMRSALTTDDYNKPGTLKNSELPKGDKYGLEGFLGDGEFAPIDFDGDTDTRTESLIITPVYEGADEATIAPYLITEAGEAGKTSPFYFSALPTEGLTEANGEVTFTIIASVGNVQKVFSRTYNKTEWAANFGTLVSKMEGMGQTINLNVVLDTEDNLAGKIYTKKQFLAAYASNQNTFDFAVDMNEELKDFVVDKDVTFSGKSVTVKDIKAGFTATNNVTVLGDVIAEGKTITFGNFVTIGGKVEAKTVVKGDASLAGVINFNGNDSKNGSAAITGDVSVEGAGSKINAADKITAANVTATAGATIQFEEATVANVTATNSSVSFTADASAATVTATSATVSFAKATLSGTITATESTVTFGGGTTMPEITASKTDLELNGKVNGNATVTECTGVKGIAEITGKLALVSSTTDKNSQINAGEINVDLNSAFNAKALTAGTMDVYGIATATGVNTIETLNVQPNAEVTLTGKSVKTSYVKNANVNKNETTGKYGILNINKNLPLQTLTNNGEVNATEATIVGGSNNANIYGSFTVTGEFNQNMIADGTAITVEGENAILNINKTTALASLTNNAIVNIDAKSELTFDEATNNGEINVKGTLTETTKNTLTMKEDATISALKGAKLTMGNGTKKQGTVYVENGTKALTNVGAKYFTAVVYKWNKTVAPDVNAANAINTIIAEEGATLDDKADDETNLILKGNVTLAKSLSIGSTKNLTVDGDVTIKGETAGLKLTLTNGLTAGAQNNLFVIKSGASLTLGDNNVTLAGGIWDKNSDSVKEENSELIVENGGSFTGNDNEIKGLTIMY